MTGKRRARSAASTPPLDWTSSSSRPNPRSFSGAASAVRYPPMIGRMAAFTTAVLRRSNSWISGSTSEERTTGPSGQTSRISWRARRSFAGFA